MKFISWNIRGLMGRPNNQLLKQRISSEKPIVVMIQETKCLHHLLQTLASRIWPCSLAIALDAQGSAGGLSLLWNPSEISLSDFFSTKYSLSARFQLVGSTLSGTLTNVYGPNLLPDKATLSSLP
jgi:exonuclease III